MRKTLRRLATTALVAAGAAIGSTASTAQTATDAQLQELQQIIQRQQAQIEAQSRTLEQLQRQLQALMTQSNETRQTLEETQSRLEQAETPPKVADSDEEGVELTVSGQVNRALLFASDGSPKDQVYIVDNDNSSTRVRVVGKGRLTDDFSVGAQVEVQFESNSSASINQFTDRGVGPNNFTERKLELYLDSKSFGRLWLGQGDTASNGTSEVDLSGTGVVAYSGVADMAGGLIFVRSGAAQARFNPVTMTPLDPTVGAVFNQLDGLSRDDRIRYDTPKFYGFQLSASAVAGDRWDVAGRYAGDFGDFKLAAALAYSERAGNSNNPPPVAAGSRSRAIINGSISALHSSGINATFASGVEDRRGGAMRQNPEFFYVKLGHRGDWLTSLGETAIAVDYFEGEHASGSNHEGHSYGIGFVQNFDKIATEIYLGARVYELERPGINYDDIVAVMSGARIKF